METAPQDPRIQAAEGAPPRGAHAVRRPGAAAAARRNPGAPGTGRAAARPAPTGAEETATVVVPSSAMPLMQELAARAGLLHVPLGALPAGATVTGRPRFCFAGDEERVCRADEHPAVATTTCAYCDGPIEGEPLLEVRGYDEQRRVHVLCPNVQYGAPGCHKSALLAARSAVMYARLEDMAGWVRARYGWPPDRPIPALGKEVLRGRSAVGWMTPAELHRANGWAVAAVREPPFMFVESWLAVGPHARDAAGRAGAGAPGVSSATASANGAVSTPTVQQQSAYRQNLERVAREQRARQPQPPQRALP